MEERIAVLHLRALVGHDVRPADTEAMLERGGEDARHVAAIVVPFARPEIDILHHMAAPEGRAGMGRVGDLGIDIGIAIECLDPADRIDRGFGQVDAFDFAVEALRQRR